MPQQLLPLVLLYLGLDLTLRGVMWLATRTIRPSTSGSRALARLVALGNLLAPALTTIILFTTHSWVLAITAATIWILTLVIILTQYLPREPQASRVPPPQQEATARTSDSTLFDETVRYRLTEQGYRVTIIPEQDRLGADLIAEREGHRITVRLIHATSPVHLEPIQQVTAAIRYYQAKSGMVVTNHAFSDQAIHLAKVNEIELWDSQQLLPESMRADRPRSTTEFVHQTGKTTPNGHEAQGNDRHNAPSPSNHPAQQNTRLEESTTLKAGNTTHKPDQRTQTSAAPPSQPTESVSAPTTQKGPAGPEIPTHATPVPAMQPRQLVKKAAAASPPYPPCATCGAPVRLRKGPNGQFLSCSTYPRCRTTRSLQDPTPVTARPASSLTGDIF